MKLLPLLPCVLASALLGCAAPEVARQLADSGYISAGEGMIVIESHIPASPYHYPARRPSGRAGLVCKYSGSVKGQQALDKSLGWLAAAQNPDGSWGDGDFQAGHALVLLSFLSHGETAESKLYGKSIEKALAFLSAQKSPHQEAAAIRTCVLCEYQAISQDPHFNALSNEAVRSLIAKINDGDSLSTLAWTCQALRAAQIARCSDPGIDAALESCLTRLLTRLPQDFASDGQANEESRATGLHALLASSKAWNEKTLRPEFALLAKQVFEEDVKKLDWKIALPQPMPSWYRGAYAAFQAGGPAWKSWRKFEPMLRQNQQTEGFWNPPGIALPSRNQRLETTAYACLMLEVYYAYMRFPEQARFETTKKELKP